MTKNKNDFNATSSEDIQINDIKEDLANQNNGHAIILESKKTEQKQAPEKKKKRRGQTLLHELRTMGILMFLGIFVGCGLGVWYFNSELRIDVNYDIDPTPYFYDIASIMNSTLGITNEDEFENFLSQANSQGKKPTDFTPAENFALAEYHSSLASSWTAIGYGEIQTVLTQSLYSEKKYNGEKATFVNISMSSLVKVAKCYEYFDNASSVNVFNGQDPQKDTATWNASGEKSVSEFKNEMGNLPNVIQPYIISDKTIIDGNDKSNVVYDDLTGNYSFTIKLDTVSSVLYYVRQVKATGGLGEYPKFYSIEQTITIDKDWNLVSIEIKDKYDAIVGIKASCTGYLKNYYTFNDPSLEMPV